MTRGGRRHAGPEAPLGAALTTLCAGVLFAAALFTLVDGLEWSLLALIGASKWVTLAVLALTSLPLLYLVWLFAASVWQTERALHGPPDVEPTPPPAP